MSVIQAGQPFAATFRSRRGGAGGMNRNKTKCDFSHNSFDAFATYHNLKHVLLGENAYLVMWDNGSGCIPIAHTYGLDQQMPANILNNSAGLFGNGHAASVCFWDPCIAYHESRAEGSFESLEFRMDAYAQRIDDCKHNLADADIRGFMKSYPERLPSKTELLTKVLENVRNETMRQQLQNILDNMTPSYMLSILALRPGSFNPDTHFLNFIKNERYYYYYALQKGVTLSFEPADLTKESVVATAENAIDPFFDRAQFPVLKSSLALRRCHRGKLMGELILQNEGCTETKTLYIAYMNNARRKLPIVMSEKSTEWDSGIPVSCVIHGETNVLSEAAAKEQLQHVGKGEEGSDFKSVDDFRGVNVFWKHSIIGKPYWRKGCAKELGWGSERNAGHIRCVIQADGDKEVCATMLHLQSNKHNTNLEECDPVILTYLNLIFGSIVRNYASYKVKDYKLGVMHAWNLEELTQKKAVSDADSVASDATVECQFQFCKTDTLVVVKEGETIVGSIPYKGQFNIIKQMLEAMVSLGTEPFRTYVQKMADLHTEFLG